VAAAHPGVVVVRAGGRDAAAGSFSIFTLLIRFLSTSTTVSR
jgi:hypothetical protein